MTRHSIEVELAYLAPTVASSLHRNGRVFTRRDQDGNDDGYHGAVMDEREVAVGDARRLESRRQPSLDLHGFELQHRPVEHSGLDFLNHQQVLRHYYPECVSIVAQATGANQVFAFDHNIRRATQPESKQRISGGQQVQQPIHVVHGDYTLDSAPKRLRDLAGPPGVNDTLRSVLDTDESLLDPDAVSRLLESDGRFAFINVWRNIDDTPVVSEPLALCNSQSVAPEDLVVFEIHYPDRIGENYFAKYAPRHEWWYYPDLTREEALLIKQWDTAGTFARTGGSRGDTSGGNEGAGCTFSFHTAFTDPGAPADAPDRQSIEVRCVALFD